MNSHLASGDEEFHNNKLLIAALSTLNRRIAQFILKFLDVDADPNPRCEALSHDELALANELLRLAQIIADRNQLAQNDVTAAVECATQDPS